MCFPKLLEKKRPLKINNFVFSFNVIASTFLMIAFGYLLRRAGIISQPFCVDASKLTFNLGFPCVVFREVINSTGNGFNNGKLVAYICIFSIVGFLVCMMTIPLFVKEQCQRGAALHGMFRGNFIAMGTMLATNIGGEHGLGVLVMLFPYIVPLYITIAVLSYAIFMPVKEYNALGYLKNIGLNIVRTPIIWGVLLGVLFNLINLRLPSVLHTTVASAASMASPIALIAIGGQLNTSFQRTQPKMLAIIALSKLVIVPFLAVSGAILLGFTGHDLVALLIVTGSSTALTGYVMAKNMHSDAELTTQTIMVTLLLSAFTLFWGVYILRSLGKI